MRDGFSHGHNSRRKEEKGDIVEVVEVDSVFKQVIKASSYDEEEEREWLKHVSWTDNTGAILALVLPALITLKRLDLMLTYGITYFEWGDEEAEMDKSVGCICRSGGRDGGRVEEGVVSFVYDTYRAVLLESTLVQGSR